MKTATQLINELEKIEMIPQYQIEAEKKTEYKQASIKATSQINKYLSHIMANPHMDTKKRVDLFGFDWAIVRDGENGLGEVAIYTDCSQRFEANRVHAVLSEWFTNN